MSPEPEKIAIRERLRRTAIAEMENGRSPHLAITIAARKISSEYLDLLTEGESSHTSLERLGFSADEIDDVQRGVILLEDDGRESIAIVGRARVTCPPTSEDFEEEGTFVPPLFVEFRILVPGGPAGAADPACIQAQLPKDRKPTRQELEEAWRRCAR